MYFLTYEQKGLQAIGLLTPDKLQVIPLVAAEQHYFGETTLPVTMLALIQGGESVLQKIRTLADKVEKDKSFPLLLPLGNVHIKAPIPRPAKNIFCIGRNYVEHALERSDKPDAKDAIPKHPVIFTKAPTTVIGPGEPIDSHSRITSALDYEVELAVIIGKKASYVGKEEAMEYIFGYTILNDITARDLQKQHLQWFRGKSLDGSAPMGPYLVHKSAVPAPDRLDISLKVNGEVRQSANTRDLIFDLPTLISTISAGITLEPGDIIATGTPGGVGVAFNPPKFLKPGDQLELTISSIGTLKNTIS